eukprot:3351278-Rhodomonas_salina.1
MPKHATASTLAVAKSEPKMNGTALATHREAARNAFDEGSRGAELRAHQQHLYACAHLPAQSRHLLRLLQRHPAHYHHNQHLAALAELRCLCSCADAGEERGAEREGLGDGGGGGCPGRAAAAGLGAVLVLSLIHI